MIGERENFDSQTQYGALVMRHYNIEGNDFDAFYDSSDRLIFVMDNTINNQKPNVLLVINPSAGKKWDEILSADYGVDLETIRPKVDNKYQKFDIEYSGLPVYDGLIKAYDTGVSLEEPLNQLKILRASAARHSAMMRLNVANENITKINATIVRTKESIVRLQARLKTLRAKLAEAKKGIGREPTKQSAAKVLKLESQIEATNEKLKRAQERLKSAQKRLETATVDAELASELLNQPSEQIKKSAKKSAPIIVETTSETPVVKTKAEAKEEEPVVIETETTEETTTVEEDEDKSKKEKTNKKVKKDKDDDIEETETEDIDETVDDDDDFSDDEFLDEDDEYDEEYDDENSENTEKADQKDDDTDKVKPLFNKDPQILNEDIAFKPISFNAPAVPELPEPEPESEPVPDLKSDAILTTETTETKETEEEEKIEKTEEKQSEPEKIEKPVLESMMPIATETLREEDKEPIAEVPVVEEQKFVPEESLKTQENINDVRQSIPVITQETKTLTETEDYKPVSPVAPMPPLPYSASSTEIVHETEVKRRPSLFYYLLLILLIVLSVFTLWLYQKNVRDTAPMFTTTVERTDTDNSTSFLKKTGKKIYKTMIMKEKEVKEVAPFLDEKPVIKPEPIRNVEPTPKREVKQEYSKPIVGSPEVIDAVPGRLGTSGRGAEEEKPGLSEDDILAKKPIYEPGPKHDEMFVADENYVGDGLTVEYVDEDVIYAPENQEVVEHAEYIENENALYDTAETEYQEEYYEE